MLILVNAACADCSAELSGVTGVLVIEWPEGNTGDRTVPLIYMRCKNRARCAHNQLRETTAHDA
jgi:hypothetical protein